MTTLTENIARRLNEAGWTCHDGTHEPGMYDQCEECQESCLAVAPVAIAAMRAHLTDEDTVEAVVLAAEKHEQWVYLGDGQLRCECGAVIFCDDDSPIGALRTHAARATLTAALDQEEQK